ncbi:hypothetical protein ABIB27_002919 [Arthrobacter sp. UYEF21]
MTVGTLLTTVVGFYFGQRATQGGAQIGALGEIPGWERRTRKDDDEIRWDQRLQELTGYMAAGTTGPAIKSQTPKKNGPWAFGCTSNV